MDSLHVDCASCRARGPACSDCVISVLLGPMTDEVELTSDEVGALDTMARSGLLPPLRLIRGSARGATRPGFDEQEGPGFASVASFP